MVLSLWPSFAVQQVPVLLAIAHAGEGDDANVDVVADLDLLWWLLLMFA